MRGVRVILLRLSALDGENQAKVQTGVGVELVEARIHSAGIQTRRRSMRRISTRRGEEEELLILQETNPELFQSSISLPENRGSRRVRISRRSGNLYLVEVLKPQVPMRNLTMMVEETGCTISEKIDKAKLTVDKEDLGVDWIDQIVAMDVLTVDKGI